jgi:DNA repair protein RecO
MLSTYISEVVMNFGEGSEGASKDVYDLLYKALNKISDSVTKKDMLITSIKFQLKMLLIMGFCVELDSCLCCGERILDEDMYFSTSMGGVICKDCAEPLGVKLKMHHKIRDFMQAMLQFDFDYESDYDKKATEKVCQVCFDLLDEYIKTHTNKRQKSAKLLKELVC